jgi:Tol biopolymer transport system component
MPRSLRILCAGIFLLATACQQKEETLPTVFDANAASTQSAATIAANATRLAPTLTPTRSAPTLPPTFTPTAIPSLTPTDSASAPTATPLNFHAAGTIYYIFNSNSIAALVGDGSSEQLILAGGPYTDLTVSPDGKLLTYIAPGAGSAREVYVSSRDGTYTQQISCLGFADVRQPVWRPDGKSIAFVAAPAPGAPRDIYIADLAGANTCPKGNNQRQFVRLSSVRARDPAWNSTGDKFFFSDSYVFGLDVAKNKLYPLSDPSGFGPDFALVHNPLKNTLAYLRSAKDIKTGETAGQLLEIDTTSFVKTSVPQGGANFYALSLRWSPDGRLLVVGTKDAVLIVDPEYGSSNQVVSNLKFEPQPAFSPDARTIAYVDGDPVNPAVPEIFSVERSGGASKQLTQHQEGSISSLNWLPG